MFEKARETGLPETWYAVPDYWDAGDGFDRVASGNAAALEMMQEVRGLLGTLPTYDGEIPLLAVYVHSALLQDPQYRYAVKAVVDQVDRDGRGVGVVADCLLTGRPLQTV